VPMALMQVRNPNRGSTEPAEEEMVTMPSKFVASPAPENIGKAIQAGNRCVCEQVLYVGMYVRVCNCVYACIRVQMCIVVFTYVCL
jgi:hypothetical protein